MRNMNAHLAQFVLVGFGIGFGPSVLGEQAPPPATAAATGISLVNIIPRSLSGEANQDSEPFLAVSPGDAKFMVATAFTPNPAGPASGKAPIFVTKNGGRTWSLNAVVPSAGTTADITHASARDRNLYTGILRQPDFPLNELFTSDFCGYLCLMHDDFTPRVHALRRAWLLRSLCP